MKAKLHQEGRKVIDKLEVEKQTLLNKVNESIKESKFISSMQKKVKKDLSISRPKLHETKLQVDELGSIYINLISNFYSY
jgi:hypothetical protein